MKIEIRNSGEVHISGYVNAVERDSRLLPPQMAKKATGPFVEKVSAGAFRRAITRNPNVRMMFNHERDIDGTLKLSEDNIGLFADMVTTDAVVCSAAAKGELRGWSFGFGEAKDLWEQYKEGVQRRTLQDFDLDEVSILTKTPAYFGTSVEVRSLDGESGERIREIRAFDDNVEEVIDRREKTPENAENNAKNSIAAAHRRRMLEITKLKGEINYEEQA